MNNKLYAVLKTTLNHCFDLGLLTKASLPDFVIEVPKNSNHGHLATNLPLILAKTQKRPPLNIASVIVENLVDKDDLLDKAEIAGPGFINFRIRAEKWHIVLSDILKLKENYGRSQVGNGQKVVVEFVSANPTGPLHIGHGRGAALGDTLCRVLSFCGYDLVREFYINDAGNQIRLLGESIFSRLNQLNNPEYPFPENGYHGEYILDLAKKILQQEDIDNMPEGEAIDTCSKIGKELVLEEIKEDLSRFRVPFDVWYSETELFRSGLLKNALDTIKDRGQSYENEGATWIRTSEFGDDKDRVIRKKDGLFTYFASDIAYHLEKRNRGFTKAINIWGADHHGYVPRIKAAISAQGFPEDWLSVVLIQLAKLWKDGHEIKMSKRAGSYVTLQELVAEVGVDAARFIFLTKSHDSTLDFDVDLVKKADSDNPVYYVQYAHARICSIFRKAESAGIVLPLKPDGLLGLLVLEEEMSLIRTMSVFSSLVEDIARTLEPHRLTYYLSVLAASFHRYFNLGTKAVEHRIVTENEPLSQARLFLAEAVRTVIANGLSLLGVSAPEKM